MQERIGVNSQEAPKNAKRAAVFIPVQVVVMLAEYGIMRLAGYEPPVHLVALMTGPAATIVAI